MGIPFLDVLDVIGKVVDRVIPDPAQKMDLQLKLAQLADQEAARGHDEMMGQISTNTAEATRGNMFVAGWRPFVGWTGGIGLAYSFVIEPMAAWVATVGFHYTGTFPILDTGQLMALVTGMLGFGTMRAVEKINGVADSQPLGSPASVPVTPTATVPPKKKILGIAWPF